MDSKINHFLSMAAHNYLLITVGAVLFFMIKAAAGYLTFRHYNQKLKTIEQKLDRLLGREK